MRAGAFIITCAALFACPPPSESGTGGGGGTAGGNAGGGSTGGGATGGGSGGSGGGVAGGGTGGGLVPLVCADVDAGAPPDAGPTRTAPPYAGGFSTFCVDYANAFCDFQLRCGLEVPGTRADCITLFQTYSCGVNVDEVARGQLLFDRAAAGLCLAILAPDAGCSQIGCQSYLVADAGHGGACLTQNGCGSGTVCAGPGCGKTCQDAGALDQPCRFGQCDPGTYCDTASDRCRTPGAPGTPCTSAGSFTNPRCDSNGWCDLDAGRCALLPPAGQPCVGSSCAPGNFCDTAPNPDVCRANLAPGQACSSDTQCGTSSFCATTCNPKRPVGSACTLSTNCLSGLTCFLNVCTVRKTEGAPCRGSECVTGTQCDDITHVCERTQILGHGARCTDDQRICATGLTCTGAQANRDGGLGCFGTCVSEAIGDRCFTQSRCPPSSYCGDAGVCAASSGANPCQTSEQCTDDRYCSASRVCTPRHASGASCELSGSCAPAEDCYGNIADGGATCRATLPGLGEICANLFECQFPLTCIDGTCVAAGHRGEACVYGGYCFGLACQPDAGPLGLCLDNLRDAGEECLDLTDCASSYCDRNVCRDRCP